VGLPELHRRYPFSWRRGRGESWLEEESTPPAPVSLGELSRLVHATRTVEPSWTVFRLDPR
jgi:hypothetical protein